MRRAALDEFVMPGGGALKYRSEIDGLRAVAVLPVMFFHAGSEAFNGGYIGVDIFFIISGYLITSIILVELADTRFSVLRFYERRARRILPALMTVTALTVPFAWTLMSPSQFLDYGLGLRGIALFLSNFAFWSQSGYFGAEAERNPLIHTWSLAVEEQFYVFYPLMLIVFWRFGLKKLVVAIILGSIASLALSEWGARYNPTANFFLTPTRVWELFLGSLCAIILWRRRLPSSEVLSAIGLLLLASAIVLFDEYTPVPSVWTLWPLGGTALIILFCDEQTFSGRLLSSRPFVFIGLISYSAYLWHQPALAYLRLWLGEPDPFVSLATVLLVLPISALSWKYIEQPLRGRGVSRSLRASPWRVIFVSVGALTTIFGIGQYIVLQKGFPDRLSARELAILSIGDYPEKEKLYRSGTCFLSPDEGNSFADECTISGAQFAILGDSHAAALSVGLRANADLVSQYTVGRCSPIVGFDNWGLQTCLDRKKRAIELIGSSRPANVLLTGNWSGYLDDLGAKEALAATIESIRRKSPTSRILLVGSVPQWKPSLPEMYVRSGKLLIAPSSMGVEKLLLRRLRNSDDVLRNTAARYPYVVFYSILDDICDDQDRCISAVTRDGKTETLVWDSAHLTEYGSQLIVQRMLAKLKRSDTPGEAGPGASSGQ